MYGEFEKSLLMSGESSKVLGPNDVSCILRTNPYREQRSFTSNVSDSFRKCNGISDKRYMRRPVVIHNVMADWRIV
jgi:hypothetical protein